MAQQTKEQKGEPGQKVDENAPRAATSVVEKGEKLKKDIDGILDKIDKVLEPEAEEFVKNYVQKGGE